MQDKLKAALLHGLNLKSLHSKNLPASYPKLPLNQPTGRSSRLEA